MVKYKYDAWGNILYQYDSSGVGLANANPFRYRSYYFDIETGWYYLQSRYYDPTIGRWISSDAFLYTTSLGLFQILGQNQYTYCFNNLVVYFDIDGLWPQKVDISPWKIRIDNRNTPNEHIHIFWKAQMYSQNIDGTVHDALTSGGNPPGWVTDRLRENDIWDWKTQFSLLPIDIPVYTPFPVSESPTYLEEIPSSVPTVEVETIPLTPPSTYLETIPESPTQGFFETIPEEVVVAGVVIIVIVAVFLAPETGGGSLLLLVP